MSLRSTLAALVKTIADEAELNPSFRSKIETALGLQQGSFPAFADKTQAKRKGGRRTPALIDPVEFARQGELALRAQLAPLHLEQLRDVVAQYGMDPGKLVMKWKDADRIRDRIVELALTRATKGDAFRGP